MIRAKVATSLFAVLLLVLPLFGQERGQTIELLKNVKGREILDELRLREAVAIKVKPGTNRTSFPRR